MTIEAGFYKGRAIAGSEQYGFTNKGDEQIVLQFDVPEIATTLSTFLYFSEKAAPFAIERLRACGWRGNDVTNLDGIDANEVVLQVKYETYEGEQKMKVEIKANGGRVTLDRPLDDKAKRQFAARMKALASAPSKDYVRGQVSGPGAVDDEIPF